MTVIKRTTAAATGPNIGLLPLFNAGAGVSGVTHRWIAAQLSGNTGDVISTWAPAVGSINLQQTTTAKKPTLRIESGVRMVRTDATTAQTLIMASAPVEANVKTITIVARAWSSPTTTQGLAGLNGGSAQYNPQLTPKNVVVFWSGTGANKKRTANANIEGGSFHTITMVGDRVGATYDLNIDTSTSTETQAGTAPFQGNGQLELGQYAGTTFGSLDILEVIAWGSVLTPAQHLSVRAAMTQNYPGIIA